MTPLGTQEAADYAAAKRDFDRQGFAVLRRYVSADELQRLEEEVARYRRDVEPQLAGTEVFLADKSDRASLFRLCRLESHDGFFDTLYRDDRFENLAKLLLDDDVQREHMSLFGKAPRIGEATPPHQDGNYFKLEPNHALMMWLALDRSDAENGCIRYVPGSHRRGMRPHERGAVFGFSLGIGDYGDEDTRQEVAVEAEPGDLIVHHSLTIHRADANPSDRRRWAIGMSFFAASSKIDDSARAAHQQTTNTQWTESGKL